MSETFNMTTVLLDDHLKAGRGDQVAIYFKEERITYTELHRRVCQVSHALRALDVRPEERVALLLHDRPEFLYTFLGAVRAGCQALPLNTALTPKDYLYLLKDSRARVLVVEPDLLAQVLPIRHELDRLCHIITVGDSPTGEAISFADWVGGQPGEFAPEQTGRDEPAFWLYSSGSTGAPKGAVHLHKDLLYCTDYFAKNTLGIGPSDIIFSVPRLFFAYGIGNSLCIPLRHGASVVLVPDRPKPERVFSVLEQYRPTVFFSVPTNYAQMLVYSDERQFDLSSLRLCHTGGEPLPKAIFDRWRERFGVEIYDGLGSSEGLHIFISNRPGAVRPGSSGQIVEGYEARIVRSDGTPAAVGEIGALEVKGGSFAAYYWNKQEKSRNTFVGWWTRTGDQYYVDADGYFWFCGRNDDMIKSGGVWVSPAEVEAVLVEREEVLEAGVVAVADRNGLEKPVAFVVLKSGGNGAPELVENLRQYCKERLAPYKVPHRILFLSDLPKTASGKIQRFKLREQGKELSIF